MAWSQTDLDALDTAIRGGVRKVAYADGRSVEYHSLGEVIALRRAMKDEVAALAPAAQRSRSTVARIIR